MSPKTAACLAEMIRHSLVNKMDVMPFMFSLAYGSATASAAIRAGKKQGALVQDGADGTGAPKYRAADMSAHQKMKWIAA